MFPTDLYNEEISAERCPRPLLPQDCPEEDPMEDQGLNIIFAVAVKEEETDVSGDEECKEDVPTDNPPDVGFGSSEGRLIFSGLLTEDCDMKPEPDEEPNPPSDVPPALHRTDLSSDHPTQVQSPDPSQSILLVKTDRTGERRRDPNPAKTFPCSECGRSFTSIFSLNAHKRVHTEKEPHTCALCQEDFPHNSALIKHLKTHTGEKPFKCPKCEKSFKKNSDLAAHIRNHTGETPFSCTECGKRFTQRKNCIRHQLSHTRPFPCPDCDKRFIMKADLNKHLDTHLKEKQIPFSQCPSRQDCPEEDHMVDQVLDNFDSMPITIKEEETDVSGDEECKEDVPTDNPPDVSAESSERRLISSGLLTEDCVLKQEPDEEPNIPPDEPPTLHRTDLSSDHPTQVRSSDPSQNKTHKRSERRRRAPNVAKPFLCVECDECFTSKSSLKAHRRIHRGQILHSCAHCQEDFPHISAFIKHLKTHTGEKPFKCPECGKSFKKHSDLAAHIRNHTGETPFSCTECGKRFTQRKNCIRHQFSHTRPFPCPDCDKRFIMKADLNKHLDTHLKEKLVSCPHCDKCFASRSYLGAHMRIHKREASLIIVQNVINNVPQNPIVLDIRKVTQGQGPFHVVNVGSVLP
ncbi:uncharacterized protein [Engystomops pustulosus]|uniref:uncharacterized protein isoform X3 n=1 Tax=Engystomops pustulosus TaxID=76066 RepID=UPI003AFAC931